MVIYSGFSVKCPHCGRLVYRQFRDNQARYDLAYCDPDNINGGCDAHFVIRAIATVSAEAFKIDDPDNEPTPIEPPSVEVQA